MKTNLKFDPNNGDVYRINEYSDEPEFIGVVSNDSFILYGDNRHLYEDDLIQILNQIKSKKIETSIITKNNYGTCYCCKRNREVCICNALEASADDAGEDISPYWTNHG
jgi:hypothetical protein